MQLYLLLSIFISFFSLTFLLVKFYHSKLQGENFRLLGKVEFLNDECEKLTQINHELQHSLQQKIEEKFLAQQNESLALQKCQTMQEQILAWEQQKQQSIEHAKAAIFDVGHKLSNQLIAEHKRESDSQKEESQKKFKETTENLYKDFSNLTQIIAGLKEQVTTSQNTTDIVYKALLSPNTVGNLAEITLENILKSSNMVANVDYFIQYSIMDEDNNRLRPDAVVFLPGDNLLVIDSKASKFFLELGHAKNPSEEQEIKLKLQNTMRTHLKSLSSKDYRQAISIHLQNRNQPINHISMIMFVPTESSLEKLHEIDNQLIPDAWKNNVYPTGPVGLVNILSHAKFQISEARKDQNYHVILNEVSSLLYNITNLAGHAKKLGNNIYNSIGFFDKFAASFNSNIIAKVKKLENLGIAMKTNKQMPEMIERYQVISGAKLTMIEADANDEEKQLEDVDNG